MKLSGLTIQTNVTDFGKFQIFWKPSEKKGEKLCEGGAMAFDLIKLASETKEEINLKLESSAVLKLQEVQEVDISLTNL